MTNFSLVASSAAIALLSISLVYVFWRTRQQAQIIQNLKRDVASTMLTTEDVQQMIENSKPKPKQLKLKPKQEQAKEKKTKTKTTAAPEKQSSPKQQSPPPTQDNQDCETLTSLLLSSDSDSDSDDDVPTMKTETGESKR